VSRVEQKEKAQQILAENPERKRQFGIPTFRCEDNIKIDQQAVYTRKQEVLENHFTYNYQLS
jgi:hypothetical protein